jgi:hypothetical protein
MARVLLRGAKRHGGLRQFMAKVLEEAGYRPPKWDAQQNSTRRTLD